MQEEQWKRWERERERERGEIKFVAVVSGQKVHEIDGLKHFTKSKLNCGDKERESL